MAVNQLLKLVGAIESTAGSAATATRVLYVNEATPSQEVTSIANTTLRGNYLRPTTFSQALSAMVSMLRVLFCITRSCSGWKPPSRAA